MLESDFIMLLRCPQTGAPLVLSQDGTQLINTKHLIAYPIMNNVPLLKVENAMPYNDPLHYKEK